MTAMSVEELQAYAEMEKDWYCTAKHLHSFLEDAKHDRVANFATPCIDCKYNMGETVCFMSAASARFQRLGNITGITFTPTTRKTAE